MVLNNLKSIENSVILEFSYEIQLHHNDYTPRRMVTRDLNINLIHDKFLTVIKRNNSYSVLLKTG